MMTMMMMQRLLQNNNNNNNGYADEMRLNGIRHHSASPFSKPAVAVTGNAIANDEPAKEPTHQCAKSEPAEPSGNETQPSGITMINTVHAGTCTVTAESDDRLTSDDDGDRGGDDDDEEGELNVDDDPVDLTNCNRLQPRQNCNGKTEAAGALVNPIVSAVRPVPMDTGSSDYETSGPASKGRLAFSVENILDPNKFTRKIITPSAVLPRWRPRVDFGTDPSVTGE